MSLGLCCHYLIPAKNGRGFENTGYINSIPQHVLQLGRWKSGAYSEEFVRKTYEENITSLINGIHIIAMMGYKVFRMPSGIFPLFDQVPQHWWDNDNFVGMLSTLGDIVRANNLRVTFHPGQFCVLSSDSDAVRVNAINEINQHSWIFDSMGLPATHHHAINVHGGKRGRSDKLIDVINNDASLSSSARSRLTLENDELCYTTADLLQVYKETGTPVVWDSHHHTLNPGGLDDVDAAHAAAETWGPIKPIQHLSNTMPDVAHDAPLTKKRAHSHHIRYIPDVQLAMLQNDVIDCDIEAKLKNVSIEKLKTDFNLSL